MTLLQAIPEVVSLRGKHRTKRFLVLNKGPKPLSEANGNGNYHQSTYSHSQSNHKLGNKVNHYSSGSVVGVHYRTNGSHEQLKNRWSTGTGYSHLLRSGAPPPPLFSSTMMSSPNYRTARSGDANVFSFDQPTPLSPPVSSLKLISHYVEFRVLFTVEFTL